MNYSFGPQLTKLWNSGYSTELTAIRKVVEEDSFYYQVWKNSSEAMSWSTLKRKTSEVYYFITKTSVEIMFKVVEDTLTSKLVVSLWDKEENFSIIERVRRWLSSLPDLTLLAIGVALGLCLAGAGALGAAILVVVAIAVLIDAILQIIFA
eukprot:TRINITY_DN9982_c0_g1_i2.p1 TRINITY_DN9982_c0_g1~~TRINITY_DN9982_c0_g1_i2.p1  ORF type:complete len:151 (-),score=12.43 TRINITY_DN9982_c0_g1_i2:117-569(-)